MIPNLSATIESARTAAKLSQRELATRAGMSQATVNRILSGDRTAKMTEVIRIADATGCTVAQLTGTSIADRVQYAARATNGSDMSTMRRRLLHFMEVDAYLDDQGIA